MAGTGYVVATASQLLGAKPPQRREADEMCFRRLKAADKFNKARSKLQRSNNARAVRFAAADEAPHGHSLAGTADSGDDLLTATTPSCTSKGDEQGNSPALEGNDGSSNKRVRKLRKGTTSPSQRRERFEPSTASTTNIHDTIDSSCTDGTAGLARSASTSSRRPKRDSEIYFSPVGLHACHSRVELSEPIDDPDVDIELSTTPTQESYDASVIAEQGSGKREEKMVRRRIDRSRRVLQLTPRQLDRLTKALADSPLLQTHVRKQWWDDFKDDISNHDSDSPVDAPSLSSGSGSGLASSTLYSQPNRIFMSETRSPSITHAILEEDFALNFPNHPKAKHPTPPTTAKFGGIALADPRVHGSPIRFTSRDYRLGAKEVTVGSCSFLNVGYGASVESMLRIEHSSRASVLSRVMLQVLNHVHDRKTGKKTYVLVAELDVTESFVKATLCELATHSKTSLDDIELVSPRSPLESARADEDVIDWCALADELGEQCSLSDAVEAAACSFASLSAESCSMQTLTLMSELERLRTRHQDFMILRPDPQQHANGLPVGVHVPWISQHLDRQLVDDRESEDTARELRYEVVSECIPHLPRGVDFEGKIVWHGRQRTVRCMPLMESNDGRPPAVWVCFLNGELDYLPF